MLQELSCCSLLQKIFALSRLQIALHHLRELGIQVIERTELTTGSLLRNGYIKTSNPLRNWFGLPAYTSRRMGLHISISIAAFPALLRTFWNLETFIANSVLPSVSNYIQPQTQTREWLKEQPSIEFNICFAPSWRNFSQIKPCDIFHMLNLEKLNSLQKVTNILIG